MLRTKWPLGKTTRVDKKFEGKASKSLIDPQKEGNVIRKIKHAHIDNS